MGWIKVRVDDAELAALEVVERYLMARRMPGTKVSLSDVVRFAFHVAANSCAAEIVSTDGSSESEQG